MPRRMQYRAYAPNGQKIERKPLVNTLADGSDLFIYDSIDAYADEYWGGVSATMVREAMSEINGDIRVRINSPGGDVYDGIAILNLLRTHAESHKVTVQIDGLAASAASFVAMAGEEIVIMPNAEIMIHDASMMTWGNAEELRTDADGLDRVSGNIADAYALRAGGKAATWRERMKAETWYSAKEAVKAGLADRVADVKASKGAAAASALGNSWDIPWARYASRRDAPTPMLAGVTDVADVTPVTESEDPAAYLAAFIERETA